MNSLGHPHQHIMPVFIFPLVAGLLCFHIISHFISARPIIVTNKTRALGRTGSHWFQPEDHRNANIQHPLLGINQATDTPSLTPSQTSTATITDTITVTPTPSSTSTELSATDTTTPTGTLSITPSETVSRTSTISPTPTSSPTRTDTPTPTGTILPTASPSYVPLPTIVIILPPTQTPSQINQLSQPSPTTTPTLPDNLLDQAIQSGNLPRLGIITFTFALWTFLAVGLYLHFTDRLR